MSQRPLGPLMWIRAIDQLPPRWKFVWVNAPGYGQIFAYRTIFGNWKTKTRFSIPIMTYDSWGFHQ